MKLQRVGQDWVTETHIHTDGKVTLRVKVAENFWNLGIFLISLLSWTNHWQAYGICCNSLDHHDSAFSSVQFSRSVVSDSLQPHEPQHIRPPCPSPTSGVHPNPCPLSWWCHRTISSSVVPFSSCPMSQLFASGGQRIGVSASASVLLMDIQDWFPLGMTSWISLQSKGLWRVFSNTTFQFFGARLSL